MPLDLNDSTIKQEVDTIVNAQLEAKLKDLGYDDHAKKVIERTNAEAKAHREKFEAAEKRAKELEAKESERAKAEDERKKKEEDERKKVDDEKKTVEQRLASKITEVEEAFGKKLTALQQESVQKQQEYLDDLKARDAQILMQAVRAEAKDAGIIDPELVALLDVSKIKIEKGEPDRDAIVALLEEHKKSKPHLYDEKRRDVDGEQRVRDKDGRFVRPDPKKDKKEGLDWAGLSDEEFDRKEEALRAGRV